MPQMAPIMWLSLFIIFSISLICFNIMNYFCFCKNKIMYSNNKLIKINSLNWKW